MAEKRLTSKRHIISFIYSHVSLSPLSLFLYPASLFYLGRGERLKCMHVGPLPSLVTGLGSSVFWKSPGLLSPSFSQRSFYPIPWISLVSQALNSL